MHVFGDPAGWPQEDLIGISDAFDADLALLAYAEGVFPMGLPWEDMAEQMGWWSPVLRGVLEPGALRVTRSLRKMLKRYRCTTDADFAGVLDRCADPSREGAWIDARIREVYLDLHERGRAHSVEVWDSDDRMVGGLYGVALGGLFAGESMFHDPEFGRDASKAALVHLVSMLSAQGRSAWLIDTQWQTDHLASLGVTEITREDYLRRLDRLLGVPGPTWPSAGTAHIGLV